MTRFTAFIDPSLPLLAIDLGYSNQSRSCGIASSSTNHPPRQTDFGSAIQTTCEIISTHGPHTLILEAVLSTYHNPAGNPEIRGSFEKGRGWYHGPGVTTFAAALRFLKEINRQLPDTIHAIPLVEGFLSYKKTKSSHASDAARLLDEFHTAERFQPAPASEPICLLIDVPPEIRRYNRP